MDASPTPRDARLAGALYLVPMFCGPFSMLYVPSRIVVQADGAETARRLVASESLFRAGVASDVAIVLSEVALTAVLFALLAPAGRTLSRTAAWARLTMTMLQAVNLVPGLAALELARRGEGESVQRLFEVHGLLQHVWEIPFAFHCLLVGVLVFRSGYLPRALGVLMGVAGLGYALEGLGTVLMPSGAPVYASVVGLTALVGEVPFVFYLLFRGVRANP